MVSFVNEYILVNKILSERIEYIMVFFFVLLSGSGSGEEYEIKGLVFFVKISKSFIKFYNLVRFKFRISSLVSSVKYFYVGGRIVYILGRLLWYDCYGFLKEVFVIGKF